VKASRDVLGRKWALLVLRNIGLYRTQRFNEMARIAPGLRKRGPASEPERAAPFAVLTKIGSTPSLPGRGSSRLARHLLDDCGRVVAEGSCLAGGSKPSPFVQSNGHSLNGINIESNCARWVGRFSPRKDPVEEIAPESLTPDLGRNPHSPKVVLTPVGEQSGHSQESAVGRFDDEGC